MSLMSGSETDGDSVLIVGASGESWTEDASVLTGTGTGTGLGTGRATASVGGGGYGAGRGSGSTSASARMKVGGLIVCQIVLFCLVKFYVR